MSFQAYLDNAEKQTGKTPNDFIALAKAHGITNETKPGVVISWLKEEHSLGHGHAMAMSHVILKGPIISKKHVGSEGSHKDESEVLRLDGIKNR